MVLTRGGQIPEGLGGMLSIDVHQKGTQLLEDSQRCAVSVYGAPGGMR